jgi:AAA+ superfamily predicted ATPase
MTTDQSISSIGERTVTQFLDSLPSATQDTLTALGDLLSGRTDGPREENFNRFLTRCMRVSYVSQLVSASMPVSGVSQVCARLAIAEMAPTAVETGPGRESVRVRWDRMSIGGDKVDLPTNVALHYPPGTLHRDVNLVVTVAEEEFSERLLVEVFSASDHHDVAREILDRIADRGNEFNPYRGRILRANTQQGSLRMEIIDIPKLTQEDVVVPGIVWKEIDLAVSAVTKHAPTLDRLGLGCRRGVLLAGPPGTGKSAASNVVANELNRIGFTVVYVAAKAGAYLLSEATEAGIKLGPLVLILEDIDLYIRDRKTTEDGALSELLQAMDLNPEARVLTVASTNHIAGMDAASIRSGRFDSVLELGYPSKPDAARILRALLSGVPGGDDVDATVVAAALPEKTSGADLREIVRRSVLVNDGRVNTTVIKKVVCDNRYRPRIPESDGHYL